MTQTPTPVQASSSDPELLKLLERHPRIASTERSESADLQFEEGVWHRTVVCGDPSEPLFGLVETMDNNPMVCADRVSVPDAASTLVLLAVTPLVQAGLLLEAPAVILSFEADAELIQRSLARIGLEGEIALHCEDADLGTALAATVMAAIRTPDDLNDIDLLFEEQYGRAFYVKRDEESEWGPSLVLGQPHAFYRMRISPEEPHSLLVISLLADKNGKCGAAQMVHAMNVMCGFEESLGIN